MTRIQTRADAILTVMSFWLRRYEMCESDSAGAAFNLIRKRFGDALRSAMDDVAPEKKITDDEWHEMAEMVDQAYEDNRLPRMYHYNRNPAP